MPGAKARAAHEWAAIETPEYVRAVMEDVARRRAAGDMRAPRGVALDALEEVWVRTHSRPLANLAFRRTLAIGRGQKAARRPHASRGEAVVPLPRAADDDTPAPDRSVT